MSVPLFKWKYCKHYVEDKQTQKSIKLFLIMDFLKKKGLETKVYM